MASDRQAAAQAIHVGQHGFGRHHIIEPIRHGLVSLKLFPWEIRVGLRLDQS
jgi:hypothetical protein